MTDLGSAWRTVVCADWSGSARYRAVFVADVAERRLYRAPPATWTLNAVMGLADRLPPPTLVGLDAPIGVPQAYWQSLCERLSPTPVDFLAALRDVASKPDFFTVVRKQEDWHPLQPFFHVPPGTGTRMAWQELVKQRFGVSMLRAVDLATRANPTFIAAGIPGSVGSSAISLWKELAAELDAPRSWSIWPFEEPRDVTLVEIYPRAGYASALHDAPAGARRRVSIAKTDQTVRRVALERLLGTEWVRRHGVAVSDTAAAVSSEDDFDALLSAAGLLRILLDGDPLTMPAYVDAIAEGTIVGVGPLDLTLPELQLNARTWALPAPAPPPDVAPRLLALRDALEALGSGEHERARSLLEPLKPDLQPSTRRAGISKADRLAVWTADRWHCRYCGQPVVFPPALRFLTNSFPHLIPCHPNWAREATHPLYWEAYASCDHVVPVSRGGTNQRDNLTTACWKCQNGKADWLLSELTWKMRERPESTWDGLTAAFVAAASAAPWLSTEEQQWLALLTGPDNRPQDG